VAGLPPDRGADSTGGHTVLGRPYAYPWPIIAREECPHEEQSPLGRVWGGCFDAGTPSARSRRTRLGRYTPQICMLSLRDVVRDVEQHLCHNGPWLSQRSRVYEAPEVTVAVERIMAAHPEKIAA
jgi:hypothetical protein